MKNKWTIIACMLVGLSGLTMSCGDDAQASSTLGDDCSSDNECHGWYEPLTCMSGRCSTGDVEDVCEFSMFILETSRTQCYCMSAGCSKEIRSGDEVAWKQCLVSQFDRCGVDFWDE